MIGKIDIATVKQYPIEDILRSFGYDAGESSRVERCTISPFREETTPSFFFNTAKNLWHDFGAGAGGDSIALVQRLAGLSFEQACQYILNLSETLFPIPTQSTSNPHTVESKKAFEVLKVQPRFTHRGLLSYSHSRMIPDAVLSRYCSQVQTFNRNTAHRYQAIGFANNRNGWVLRAEGFKRCTVAACTFLSVDGRLTSAPSSSRVVVFEGFFNFLSWATIFSRENPSTDVVVLNSVTNLDSAMEFIKAHKNVEMWLDNDEAGRRCAEKIVIGCPNSEVGDFSHVYGGYNDLNEYHVKMGQLLKMERSEGQKTDSPRISM